MRHSQAASYWLSTHWEELQRVGQPTLTRACNALLHASGQPDSELRRLPSEGFRELLAGTGEQPLSGQEADVLLRCGTSSLRVMVTWLVHGIQGPRCLT